MKEYALLIVLLFLLPNAFTDDFIVENGQSIQDMIDSAKEGDSIFIKEGIYRENIIVNKSLKIYGIGRVIVDGCGEPAIKIKADFVSISSIEFFNSSEEVVIFEGGNGLIEKSKVYRGRYGIIGNKTNIKNCEIFECGGGILANNSYLEDCEIYKCGIGLEISQNNYILNFKIYNCGVGIYGENSSNNLIEKSEIYKCNNNQGEIFFINSTSNKIKECNISYGSFGIKIVESEGVEISECMIVKSRYGIKIENSYKIKIYKNLIKRCRFSISLEKSKDILINYNDIVESEMYSIDASYSICDARKNYWGKIIPQKFHKKLSKIRYVPWLLEPVYNNYSFEEYNKKTYKRKEEEFEKINKKTPKIETDDFDPLVDIWVGVKIKRVRFPHKRKLTVLIDGKKNSSIFYGDENPEIIFWENVDDKKQFVEISFNLGKKFDIFYDLATGGWFGDDFLRDDDSYGHIKYSNYEIWFDITYNDYDNDGLTYWEEVNIYHTDPYLSDYGIDYDGDGISIEWEDKYGYEPFDWEDHANLDPDNDGLNNLEEYMMSDWFSDPFRRDIYIEVDCMEEHNEIKHIMPEKSIQMLYSAFSKKNIVLFIDNGIIEEMDIIPYKDSLNFDDLNEIYQKYFLHNQSDNPRKGVFHYAIICHEIEFWRRPAGGMNFKRDAFVLGSYYIQKWRPIESKQIVAHASLFMHELGHQLGFNNYIGVDNEHTRFPWQLQYWLFGNYKSCMNYRYSFSLVDYSDGSHGFLDYDDWGNIDLSRFNS